MTLVPTTDYGYEVGSEKGDQELVCDSGLMPILGPNIANVSEVRVDVRNTGNILIFVMK